MNPVRKQWNGAAAIVNRDDKLLMIKSKDTGTWSVPSGGIETGESPEEACVRETWEETGFHVQVKQLVHIKNVAIRDYDVTTYYYSCELIGGQITYHDPDDSIEEIEWKTLEELKNLPLLYEEDLENLLALVST